MLEAIGRDALARARAGICEILIVDDDPDCRSAYSEALQQLGYTCKTAASASTALRLLTSTAEIGIVLTDISMPGMDGISFLEEVSARFESTRPLVCIAVTGYGSLDMAIRAMRSNAVDFLSKPVSIEDLQIAVRRAISRWSAMVSRFRLMALAAKEDLPDTFAGSEDGNEGGLPDLLEQVRGMVKARRRRADFLDSDLFADPVWDILLDLTSARLEGSPVTVMSACAAAQVPTTTALRYLRQMEKMGLVKRTTDVADKRRVHVQITDKTFETMVDYLRAIGQGARSRSEASAT
jgi:CheY-like chemotaxis protein